MEDHPPQFWKRPLYFHVFSPSPYLFLHHHCHQNQNYRDEQHRLPRANDHHRCHLDGRMNRALFGNQRHRLSPHLALNRPRNFDRHAVHSHFPSYRVLLVEVVNQAVIVR